MDSFRHLRSDRIRVDRPALVKHCPDASVRNQGLRNGRVGAQQELQDAIRQPAAAEEPGNRMGHQRTRQRRDGNHDVTGADGRSDVIDER